MATHLRRIASPLDPIDRLSNYSHVPTVELEVPESQNRFVAQCDSTETCPLICLCPCKLAPITAGAQACRWASSSQTSIADAHASGSPTGSALARLTPNTTR